jgi:hypothetical protein
VSVSRVHDVARIEDIMAVWHVIYWRVVHGIRQGRIVNVLDVEDVSGGVATLLVRGERPRRA